MRAEARAEAGCAGGADNVPPPPSGGRAQSPAVDREGTGVAHPAGGEGPSRWVSARGVDFALLEEGDAAAPLALCLHGFPDSPVGFRPLMRSLGEAGWHAVAPWMRGYHPTGPAPDGRYQQAALALDAVALIEALSPDGTGAVIGHDWGAAAAVGAGILRPDAVRSLVSMAVPHPAVWAAAVTGDAGQVRRSWYMWFFQQPVVAEALVGHDGMALVETLWREWSPGWEPDPDLLDAARSALSAPGCIEAALGYYRQSLDVRNQAEELAATQVDAAFGRLGVPALFLAGALDGCIPPTHAEESRGLCDAAVAVETLDGCGHFLHLERPEAVAERVLDWIGGPV